MRLCILEQSTDKILTEPLRHILKFCTQTIRKGYQLDNPVIVFLLFYLKQVVSQQDPNRFRVHRVLQIMNVTKFTYIHFYLHFRFGLASGTKLACQNVCSASDIMSLFAHSVNKIDI